MQNVQKRHHMLNISMFTSIFTRVLNPPNTVFIPLSMIVLYGLVDRSMRHIPPPIYNPTEITEVVKLHGSLNLRDAIWYNQCCIISLNNNNSVFFNWHYAEATITTPLDKWLICLTK